MPKIVILGSCKYEPYEILAVPNKIKGAWNTEKGYQKAAKIFYPAIEQSDIVIVYAPEEIGEHTQRDMEYAKSQGKPVFIVGKLAQCWRERTERKECPVSSCCYNASCKALFEYWKFSNSPEWKKMVQEELERVRHEEDSQNTLP